MHSSRLVGRVSLLAVTVLFLNGCLAAAAAGGALAGEAAWAGVRSLGVGDVDVRSSTMEVAADGGQAASGTLRIRGSFQYQPAEIGGDRFVDFSQTLFVFELKDDEGEQVTCLAQTPTLPADSVSRQSVASNREYEFAVTASVPTNQLRLVSSHEFVRALSRQAAMEERYEEADNLFLSASLC